MHSRILDVCSYLPEQIETNEDLSREYPDWDMSRIGEKTGIHARHRAAPEQTASDLARLAACKLLDRSATPREEIDYLIFSTQTPDHFLPSNACILHKMLGLGMHVGAIDISPGCSGYVYGLQWADSLIASGAAKRVLLVTADTYGRFVNAADRTVRTLFGDGASATLIGPTTESDSGGIGSFLVGTDSRGTESLIVPAGGFRLPHSNSTAAEKTDAQGSVRSQDNLFMDGQAVFAFSLNMVPRVINGVLAKAKLTRDEIDWFVLHQANKFMLENLAKGAKLPANKMAYYMAEVGNTVSSSIPLVLEAFVDDGKIKPGQRLLLAGFGVGYSWAACQMTWGNTSSAKTGK